MGGSSSTRPLRDVAHPPAAFAAAGTVPKPRRGDVGSVRCCEPLEQATAKNMVPVTR
jgi:hypothetical protein